MKKTPILLLLLILSCTSKIGNPKTVNLYHEEIQNGSNISQIIENYGNYANSWKDKSGNQIYQYSYLKNNYDLVSQIPIINHFGWITSRSYEVILVVDINDKLIEQRNFRDKAKARNSLICNPKIYSCVRKIYQSSRHNTTFNPAL
ncbi:MAG: hypothetical protein ACJAW3_000496 [Lentimonas sp.]|jgi:hypothetical protein